MAKAPRRPSVKDVADHARGCCLFITESAKPVARRIVDADSSAVSIVGRHA
jgi:hypothetical protein